jgi:nucleotide-binding universal stress UspA family protein
MTTASDLGPIDVASKQPARESGRIARILVGVDFSDVSERALGRALDVAEQLGASVIVCHVVPIPLPMVETAALGLIPANLDMRESAAIAEKATLDLVARHDNGPVELTSVIRQGDAATEIAAAAREMNADLIVVGTQARTGVARILLGDVAQTVVRSTNLPVMLLHDPLDDAS